MSTELKLSSFAKLLNEEPSEGALEYVEAENSGLKMLDCIESQIVGHELGPVVAFSDLLELGADCTVLGDDYINEHGEMICQLKKISNNF